MDRLQALLAVDLVRLVVWIDVVTLLGQDVDELEYYLTLLSSLSTGKRSQNVIRRLLGTYSVLKKTPGATILEPVLHYSEYGLDESGKRSVVETYKADIEAYGRRRRLCAILRCFP